MKVGEEAPRSLAATAKAALMWGAGFTILRDVIQFASMILLVRLLSPQDYGQFALAQSIYLLISVLTVKHFLPHALQARDPAQIPWQVHYTAGAALSVLAFFVTLAAAGLLLLSSDFESASAPLAVLAAAHIIDAPAQFVGTRLRVAHQWRTLGTLSAAGMLLGVCLAILIALLGGGVWALISTMFANTLVYAVYLFVPHKWRPDWSWDWRAYREPAGFAATRVGGAGIQHVRVAAEQAILGGAYNLAQLGIFNRAVGLANLLAGRIGSEATNALHPVVTRADRGSERFRRLAALVLQGVIWVSVPAAAVVMLNAEDLVAILYGPKWMEVAPLLPLAAAYLAAAGIAVSAYTLLLANDRPRACFAIDAVSATSAVGLMFWLIPLGIPVYLGAMALHGLALLLLALILLRASGGVELRAVLASAASALAAALVAAAAVALLRTSLALEIRLLRLMLEASVFALAYTLVLRLFFPNMLRDLLQASPAGGRLAQFLRVPQAAPVTHV